MEVFDPASHPVLIAFGQQLRDLAGDTAFRAGRDYLKQGAISEPTISGTTARASVRGSTDYQITIVFPPSTEIKVTCTCPAHRRKKHCKHVVAISVALIEQPSLFSVIPAADIPVVQPPPRRRRGTGTTAKQQAEELKEQQRRAGLELVDRVIAELADCGIGGLGTEQLALLSSAAETVHGLKLRRLGNALSVVKRLVVERGGDDEALDEFASVLTELHLMRQMLHASFTGSITLDPALAEELIGKVWRATELEPVSGFELIPIGREANEDGDFRVESTYLVETQQHELYVERQITPRGLRGEKPPSRRLRLLVDEARRYPGAAPRRIKLTSTRDAPLNSVDIGGVVAGAEGDVTALRQRLIERLSAPVIREEITVLFRPNGIVAKGDLIAALDERGQVLPILFPDAWSKPTVRTLTTSTGEFAFLGVIEPTKRGMQLRCLSIVGDLGWAVGPVYPDLP